jgi:hypothetical protein
MVIPFICGFTMGLAIGFVGASFPIVFSLLGPDPTLGATLSTTVLAFSFGYMGMMLSPIHICLIVTNEHFRTCLIGSLRRLVAPAAIILGAGFLYFLLIRTVFP